MYYKEEIVNGVLCFKGTPDGDWIPFTPKELTAKLQLARGEQNKNQEDSDHWEREVNRLSKELEELKNKK